MEPAVKSTFLCGTDCELQEKVAATPTSHTLHSRTPNVLDFLNDDCWRYILNYVPIKDIVRSERVSRRWQALVRWYLQDKDVRFSIQTITNIWATDSELDRRKCVITLRADNAKRALYVVLNKWDSSVTELIYDAKDSNEADLLGLSTECQHLEDITFVRLRGHSSCEWVALFTRLKRISFENCTILDGCVTEFLKYNAVEELVIRMSESITGSFLQNGEYLKNLKTLVVSRCPMLEIKYFLFALEPVNCLSGLTTLELRDVSDVVHVGAYMLLEKMPHLEHLTLDSRVGVDYNVAQAVTKLDKLRYLGWCNGEVFTGDKLRAALKDGSRLTRPESGGGAHAPADLRPPLMGVRMRRREFLARLAYQRLIAARAARLDLPG